MIYGSTPLQAGLNSAGGDLVRRQARNAVQQQYIPRPWGIALVVELEWILCDSERGRYPSMKAIAQRDVLKRFALRTKER